LCSKNIIIIEAAEERGGRSIFVH